MTSNKKSKEDNGSNASKQVKEKSERKKKKKKNETIREKVKKHNYFGCALVIVAAFTVIYVTIGVILGFTLESYANNLEFLDDIFGYLMFLFMIRTSSSIYRDLLKVYEENEKIFSSRESLHSEVKKGIEHSRNSLINKVIPIVVSISIVVCVILYFGFYQKWSYVTWGTQTRFIPLENRWLLFLYYSVIILGYTIIFFITSQAFVRYWVVQKIICTHPSKIVLYEELGVTEILLYGKKMTRRFIVPSVLMPALGLLLYVFNFKNHAIGAFFICVGVVIFLLTSLRIYLTSNKINDKITEFKREASIELIRRIKVTISFIRKGYYERRLEKIYSIKNYLHPSKPDRYNWYYITAAVIQVVSVIFMLYSQSGNLIAPWLGIISVIALLIIGLYLLRK